MDVICYRGGGGECPENTIEGIQHCLNVDANWWIEIDVRITRDRKIVLCHDDHLSRLAGDERVVLQSDYQDLRDVNIGTHFGGDSFYVMPLLEEVFDRFPEGRFVIDIHDSSAVDGIVDLVKNRQDIENTIVVSTDDGVIKAVKSTSSTILCGAATSEARWLWLASMIRIDDCFPLRSEVLLLPAKMGFLSILSNCLIKHVHDRDKRIWIYSEDKHRVTAERMAGRSLTTLISSREQFEYYKNRGIDGVFTDMPLKLKKVLNTF